MQKNIVISDENMNYIFFQVINRIEAKRVLDVGMFLKRTGSVSRGMMDEKISERPWTVMGIWMWVMKGPVSLEIQVHVQESGGKI